MANKQDRIKQALEMGLIRSVTEGRKIPAASLERMIAKAIVPAPVTGSQEPTGGNGPAWIGPRPEPIPDSVEERHAEDMIDSAIHGSVMQPPPERDAPPPNRRLTQADVDAFMPPRNPHLSSLAQDRAELVVIWADRREANRKKYRRAA